MTSNEIKEQNPMPEFLRSRGIVINRAGFAKCIFHSDRKPSMKVYKDSVYCFSCGAHGDIFTIVKELDGLSFKEAYLSLGGTYEHDENLSALAIAKKKIAEDRRKQVALLRQKKEQFKRELFEGLTICRRTIATAVPFSDEWATAVFERERLERILEEKEDELVEGSQ